MGFHNAKFSTDIDIDIFGFIVESMSRRRFKQTIGPHLQSSSCRTHMLARMSRSSSREGEFAFNARVHVTLSTARFPISKRRSRLSVVAGLGCSKCSIKV